MCFMTKCPYVPPHEWNLDFPHTMLRAKAIKFKKGEVSFGEKFLSSTDVHGQFAGIPVVVQVANALNRTKPMRKLLDATLHVHPEAWLPDLAASRFRWSAKKQGAAVAVTNGERTPGKVAIFATCYVNYNEPGIGHDLLKVLAHNDIPYEIVEKESCCGMPKLELGDLDAVAKHKEANVPVLARYAKEGWAILSPVPSCTLTPGCLTSQAAAFAGAPRRRAAPGTCRTASARPARWRSFPPASSTTTSPASGTT